MNPSDVLCSFVLAAVLCPHLLRAQQQADQPPSGSRRFYGYPCSRIDEADYYDDQPSRVPRRVPPLCLALFRDKRPYEQNPRPSSREVIPLPAVQTPRDRIPQLEDENSNPYYTTNSQTTSTVYSRVTPTLQSWYPNPTSSPATTRHVSRVLYIARPLPPRVSNTLDTSSSSKIPVPIVPQALPSRRFSPVETSKTVFPPKYQDTLDTEEATAEKTSTTQSVTPEFIKRPPPTRVSFESFLPKGVKPTLPPPRRRRPAKSTEPPVNRIQESTPPPESRSGRHVGESTSLPKCRVIGPGARLNTPCYVDNEREFLKSLASERVLARYHPQDDY